jgi:hypothetical protein
MQLGLRSLGTPVIPTVFSNIWRSEEFVPIVLVLNVISDLYKKYVAFF